MALKFGTSGVRGLVSEFTAIEIEKYIHAFVLLLKSHKNLKSDSQIFLAGDFRESTPQIMNQVALSLVKLGFRPVSLGLIPTPALAWNCIQQKSPGIMITGSHIPADRNGLKFYFAEGEILKSDEEFITNHLWEIENPALAKYPYQNIDGKAEFIERYTRIFPANYFAGYKVCLYEHSSVAAPILWEILTYFGCEIISFGRSSTFLAVDTEALSSVQKLSDVTIQNRADLLVSTDGDGDRPLILDENGNLVKGDIIGLISGMALNANVVVTPITSTSSVEASTLFTKVIRTKVGSPFVIEAMMNSIGPEDRILGFEANGGVLLGPNFAIESSSIQALPTRDSILPILLMLYQMKITGKKLSEILKGLPQSYAQSDLVRPIDLEKSQRLLKLLSEKSNYFFESLSSENLGNPVDKNQLDGIRFKFADDSIIHFRPSGNAPEFRIYTESPCKLRAELLLERAKNWIINQ